MSTADTGATGTAEAAAYRDLRDRDYFHLMLNLDAYPDFRPTARRLAEQYLAAARDRQRDPGLEAELRPFRYTPEAFAQRLDEIYQGLADDVDRYEAARSWTMRTRDDVVDWLRQMAPFNQTDGAWLRKIAPVGPMNEVDALLFGIYSDEVGAGDPDRNHANVYTDLLRSVDIDLPDLRSRDYALNPDIVDAAYTLPLFQLVVSEFSEDYYPELLGMTQYLEWSAIELRNMVLLHEHFGIDTRFYELHVAIDNAAAGHGAMAKRAIEAYLEGIRLDLGDEVVQAQWQRIWTGYVAFATTGNLGQEVADRRRRQPTSAQKVAALIRDRAPKARLNHGRRRLGGRLINDLFADPDALMTALVTNGLVVPEDPDRSTFLDLLRPDGPMYRVFDDDEIDIWRAWIRSLRAAVPAVEPAALTVPDPAAAMVALVDAMRPRQEGVGPHQGEILRGPDPADPARTVEQPVAAWFTQPATALMRALADPANGWIRPGDAAGSRFVTELLSGSHRMARTLAAPLPDGTTGAQVVTAWIDAGCPVPDAAPEPVPAGAPARPLTLLSPPERVAAHPTGAVHGSGSVH